MFIHIDTREYEAVPLIQTKILNKAECGIAGVGASLGGEITWRESGKLFPRKGEIAYVLFLGGKQHKELPPPNNYEADFDIYLLDGRVIEVNSIDRATIEAALRYAPKKDIRAQFRSARGCL